MAIIYAFACLFFSACNDFVFKLFARKPRSRGIFISLVGVCWALALTYPLLKAPEVTNWKATIIWGCISGLFSLLGNILLIEGMGKQSAGVCSTIYRLNLVPVVLLAWLLLGETITLIQLLGVILALIAIIGFFPNEKRVQVTNPEEIKILKVGFFMVVIAAFLRAGMGISYKYGFSVGASKDMVVFINSLFWIVGGLLYSLLREKQFAIPDKKMLGYGLSSGILVAGIVFFMAAMLACGNASIVLPIAQMSFLATFVMGVLVLKEPISLRKIISLIAGVAAILVLSLS